jgi:purine-nucleoside phosphorylase
MTELERKLENSFQAIRDRIPFEPQVAVVLGSGLGNFVDEIRQEASIGYDVIPEFPVSTVAGHAGRFVFGYVRDVPVVLMQGRVHYYEGYEMEDVVLPIRLMRRMGAKKLVLTNASGGIRCEFRPGDLMLITDQIASFVPSPLRGKNPESLGERFPDMSSIYDPALCDVIRHCAAVSGIPLREGVYLQTPGPQYESPAEVRMYRNLGADAVGMSTAVEAIAAVHCGFAVCGISCITNAAAGMSGQKLSHEEVAAAAGGAAPKFRILLQQVIGEIVSM